jgi:drug efflux transport system ATP-binding protein
MIDRPYPVTGEKSQDVALSFDSVSKSFLEGGRRIKALDGLSIRVLSGMVTGLIGPDGAGKTTLMRLATGLLIPDEGRISVLGVDVVRDPLKVQDSAGYMPQRFGLYEDLTVQENLDLYSDLQGVPEAERPDRYGELMSMTGLSPFTRRLAGALSGGMKQKLGLACALVRRPRLLLLDEPTVGVDPVSRRELWAIIYRLVEKQGMSVFLSTAYLDEAERCTEVALLHEGRLLGMGPPSSFSRRVEGRSFRVSVPGISKRTLQEQLAVVPGVADSVIQGDTVRVVMDEGGMPRPEKLLPGQGGVSIMAVEPRFEDSFIIMIKKDSSETPRPGSPKDTQIPSGSGEVIVVKDVKRRFGDFYAVKGVSFTVLHGEVFGLLGANGAGKSTTFRMLCGLLPASEGTLRVAGEDLRRAAAKARGRIGYMAQRFSLYADLSVMENLRFFGSAYGLQGKIRHDRLSWALDEFGLRSIQDAKSGDLPLGYKQRLALATALMHEPEILFLDEPTSGVDPIARREFWHRINALAGQGVTVLVTTHFMEEAEYCDRLVMMSEGEILAEGTPAEMKDLFRTPERPEPTMEDAFIGFLEAR